MIASRQNILTDINKLGLAYRIESDLRKHDWQQAFYLVSIGSQLLVVNNNTVTLSGLALAKDSRISKIQLIADGHSFNAHINSPSPELGKQLPEVEGSSTSKWTCAVKLPAPPAKCKLNLRIILENSNAAYLGELRVLPTQVTHLDIGDKNAQLLRAIGSIQKSRKLMLERIAKGRDYVFVAGNARSGTTALCRLLNLSPEICIGMERYSAAQNISAMFLEEQNFFDPKDKRYSRDPALYEQLKPKFGFAKYIGDKLPQFTSNWKNILLNIPSAKIIYIFRNIYDVASSYNERAKKAASGHDKSWTPSQDHAVAVNDWNRTLNDVQNMVKASQVYFVKYEDVFVDKLKMTDLFNYLGVNIDFPEIAEAMEKIRQRALVLQKKERSLSTEEKNYIDSHADFAAYEQVLRLYEKQW